MTVSKKFKIGLMSVLAVILIILSIYAYNNLGYTLSSKEAYQIAYQNAYQNAGVASKDLLSKSFEKSRLGLKATYHITLKTETTDYSYTIDASTDSIMQRQFHEK